MSLHLHSERFHPTGNIDAQAARRAIGKPSLDQWNVVLRETLQNSWDARIKDEGPIGFSIDAWGATTKQRTVLMNDIFSVEPPHLDVRSALHSRDLGLLLISDVGTMGLGGPTRADVSSI